MANVSVEKQSLQDIADSIRIKRQVSDKYKPGEMDEAILQIETDHTGDATATEDDIIYPKTAYVAGDKLVGAIIPSYENTDIKYNVEVSNNTGLGVYDINTDEHIALVGTRNATNFYICQVDNNGISDNIKVNIQLSNISNAYPYKLSDVKFSVDDVIDNVIQIYGVAEYHTNTLNDTTGQSQVLVFAMEVDTRSFLILQTAIWTQVNTNETNINVGPDYNSFDYYYQIFPLSYNVNNNCNIVIAPCYTDYGSVGNPWEYPTVTGTEAKLFYSSSNNSIEVITGNIWYGADKYYYYYNNYYQVRYAYYENNPLSSNYYVINLNGTLGPQIQYNTSTEKLVLMNNLILIGNNLYDSQGTIVHTYTTELDPTLYKEYLGEHIYQIDWYNYQIKVFAFNTQTYQVTLETTITNAITNYIPYQTQIHNKVYCNSKYIAFALSNNLVIKLNENTQSQVIKSLTRQGVQYQNVSDADALANEVKFGKIFYNNLGKFVGTMKRMQPVQNVPVWYINCGAGFTLSFSYLLDWCDNGNYLSVVFAINNSETLNDYRLDEFATVRSDLQVGDLVVLNHISIIGQQTTDYLAFGVIKSIEKQTIGSNIVYDMGVYIYDGVMIPKFTELAGLTPNKLKKNEIVLGVTGTLSVPSGNTLNQDDLLATDHIYWTIADRTDIPAVNSIHTIYGTSLTSYEVGDVFVYPYLDVRGTDQFTGTMSGKIINKTINSTDNTKVNYTIQLLDVYTKEIADIRTTNCGHSLSTSWASTVGTAWSWPIAGDQSLVAWDSFIPKRGDILIMTDVNETVLSFIIAQTVSTTSIGCRVIISIPLGSGSSPISQQDYNQCLAITQNILA